jgi:hypothetical protein
MKRRKLGLGPAPDHPELDNLLDVAKGTPVSDEELAEQHVSFAYGNAPLEAEVTKDFVRQVARHWRMPDIRGDET